MFYCVYPYTALKRSVKKAFVRQKKMMNMFLYIEKMGMNWYNYHKKDTGTFFT